MEIQMNFEFRTSETFQPVVALSSKCKCGNFWQWHRLSDGACPTGKIEHYVEEGALRVRQINE
jgi:hypothetical protein